MGCNRIIVCIKTFKKLIFHFLYPFIKYFFLFFSKKHPKKAIFFILLLLQNTFLVYSRNIVLLHMEVKPMEEIIFPNQIRMFRRVRGKPMKSLADVLGLSLSAVSKIEKGYRRIDEAQLAKISAFLNCPKEAIFVTENSSQPEVVKAWKREQERRKKINAGSGLKTLGAGLRYIRGEKDLTLQDVTRGAKLTLSVYHRIEMGQREVDEKTFKNIAHALGYSESDLQLRIYELDMSGALDELKQQDGKTGVFAPKGGYNDLPVSRFMMRSADSKEINVPIFGMPQADGSILIDRDNPMGSLLCPSTLADKNDLYAVRLTGNNLSPIIPMYAVLVVSPTEKMKNGDIAIQPLKNNTVRVVNVFFDKNGAASVISTPQAAAEPLNKTDEKKLQKVVMISLL